jgi:acyl-coenzyme A synthetase/AMP-(fatty) acid ligase
MTTVAVAHVLLAEGHQADRTMTRTLRAHARQTLAAHKRPHQYVFVDALPTTSTGKLARFRLRQAATGRVDQR